MNIRGKRDFGKLINELELTYGAELGVAGGEFSEHLLKTSNLKILFSIDRWTDHHDYKEYLVAKEKLSQYNERSVILKLSFDEALQFFTDNSLEFIYIDGYAHTGFDKGKTLYDWWPKLKKGGVFAGHDYDEMYDDPPMIKIVDNFSKVNDVEINVTEKGVNEEKFPSWYCIKK
jgi:hypothetical protein